MLSEKVQLLTAEDYCALPDNGPRYQLVQGELIMAPAPNRFHQDISLSLTLLLGKHTKLHRLGKLYVAPIDVYLDEHNVFQPDLVYIANDRAEILTDRGIDGSPTLIIEILSPSTATLDQTRKRQVYRSTGVPEMWIIDPDEKTLTVHDLAKNEKRAVLTIDDTFEPALFPGLRIQIAKLF